MTRRFSFSRYRSVAATLGFIVPLAFSVAGCSTVSSVFGSEPEQAEAPPPGQENTSTVETAIGTTESRAASTRARAQGLVAAAPAARADAKGTTASDGSAVRYAPYVPRQGGSSKSLALKPATPPPAPVPDPEVTRVAEAEPSQPVAAMPAPGPRPQPVPDPEVTRVAEPEPPAPTVKAEPLPDATAPQVAAQNPPAVPSPAAGQARDAGPSAPPAQVNTQPPPPAAPPRRGPMDTFEEQYKQRLAQSAASTSDPTRTQPLPARYSDDLYPPPSNLRDEPIHLVPPSGHTAAKTETAAPAAAPLATFQVAHVVFKPRTSQLTQADRAALKDVVQLYKKERGQVRILAYGTAADPWARADSIAAELVKQGIPAKAILVGADEAAFGDGGATVFFDIL